MGAAKASSFEDRSKSNASTLTSTRTTTMRTTLRLATLAALTFLTVIGSLSAAQASSCDERLKKHYKCSATYDNGGSSEYCLRAEAGNGSGIFALAEPSGDFFLCSCAPKGKAPNVEFGGGGRDFVCRRDAIVLAGKVTGIKLTGYGSAPALRSEFTCRAVETCP
jgi:hypothetical protein